MEKKRKFGKFNGFLYRLLVRDLKVLFPHNFTNNRKYFILHGTIVNFILLKEVKHQVEVIYATEFEIVRRKTYRCARGYKKIANKIRLDFLRWNNLHQDLIKER